MRHLALALVLCATPAFAQGNKPSAKAVLEQTDAIAGDVVTARGLSLLAPIVKAAITPEEVRAKLLKSFDEEYKPGELEAEAITLKKLGLIPAALDYKQTIIDLLTEQIAGFYDTDDKELYLVEGIAPDRGALAHEIGHALQDQHFDLKKLQEARKGKGSDGSLALSALIEGDAMGVMLDDELKGKLSFALVPKLPEMIRAQATAADPKSKKLSGAPAFLREGLIFPYIEGLAFVYALRQKGPWSVINEAFADPPASTEQILHPERYLRRDAPSEVPKFLPATLARTHADLADDVMGELQLRIYFAQALGAEEAAAAAEGWDGDRLVSLSPKALDKAKLTEGDLDSVIILSVSVWDSEGDAKEAEAALLAVAKARYSGLKERSRGVYGADAAGAPRVLLFREKGRVYYAEGLADPVVKATREELIEAGKAIQER